jgi:hypothetical protein
LMEYASETLKAKLPYYRLLIKGIATKKELNTEYTFDDMMELCAVLDMQSDIEEEITKITIKPPEDK